jgi:hypothetical protein
MMAQSPHSDQFDRALAKIRTLNNPGSVHQFMNNVRLQSARGRLSQLQADAMRCAGLRRLAELAGQDANDPLTRRWIEGITAFEALTGKPASRTRPMLQRHGAKIAFEKLVDRTSGTSGFEQMIEAGLHDMTAEWIVLEFKDVFDDRICEMAEERLSSAGVEKRP